MGGYVIKLNNSDEFQYDLNIKIYLVTDGKKQQEYFFFNTQFYHISLLLTFIH